MYESCGCFMFRCIFFSPVLVVCVKSTKCDRVKKMSVDCTLLGQFLLERISSQNASNFSTWLTHQTTKISLKAWKIEEGTLSPYSPTACLEGRVQHECVELTAFGVSQWRVWQFMTRFLHSRPVHQYLIGWVAAVRNSNQRALIFYFRRLKKAWIQFFTNVTWHVERNLLEKTEQTVWKSPKINRSSAACTMHLSRTEKPPTTCAHFRCTGHDRCNQNTNMEYFAMIELKSIETQLKSIQTENRPLLIQAAILFNALLS